MEKNQVSPADNRSQLLLIFLIYFPDRCYNTHQHPDLYNLKKAHGRELWAQHKWRKLQGSTTYGAAFSNTSKSRSLINKCPIGPSHPRKILKDSRGFHWDFAPFGVVKISLVNVCPPELRVIPITWHVTAREPTTTLSHAICYFEACVLVSAPAITDSFKNPPSMSNLIQVGLQIVIEFKLVSHSLGCLRPTYVCHWVRGWRQSAGTL